MITETVIYEMYKAYSRRRMSDLDSRLHHFVGLLSEKHKIRETDTEIFVDSLEESNFFRRFLKRSIMAVVEFDKYVAFVFRTHIIFFNRETPEINIHIRREKKKTFWQRLFKGSFSKGLN